MNIVAEQEARSSSRRGVARAIVNPRHLNRGLSKPGRAEGTPVPNTMPSQVVLVIEKFFPHVTENVTVSRDGLIYSPQLDVLQGIVNLVHQIPSELINVPPNQYADLVLAIAIIEEQSKFRASRGGNFPIKGISNLDVATVLYRVLSQCPDEFPPAHTVELLFVTDPDLRKSIRQDIGAIDRAIAHAERKAATVLAGAAIEALLLGD
jgi:hypothetical protein